MRRLGVGTNFAAYPDSIHDVGGEARANGCWGPGGRSHREARDGIRYDLRHRLGVSLGDSMPKTCNAIRGAEFLGFPAWREKWLTGLRVPFALKEVLPCRKGLPILDNCPTHHLSRIGEQKRPSQTGNLPRTGMVDGKHAASLLNCMKQRATI